MQASDVCDLGHTSMFPINNINAACEFSRLTPVDALNSS